jgi:tetratricopeptide (TPR) repeat protein
VLEEYEKAIADFTQLIKLDPKTAFRYRDRARVYHVKKEHEKALVDYTEAIKLASQTAGFYEERGIVYAEVNEYEKALADLTRAIELQPSRARLYYSRGRIFLKIKDYQQAIIDFTSAIELDVTYKGAYVQRGYAYLWLKKSELAYADFARYVALTPDDIRAAWMVFYSSLGKQCPGPEIIEVLEKIIARAPQSDIAQICQGVVLGLRSDYSNSITQLERALQLVRPVEEVYFWKGLFHAYLGQEAETTQAIKQALEAGSPPALLTPLYWLEQERPEMYQAVAVPFLVQYGV